MLDAGGERLGSEKTHRGVEGGKGGGVGTDKIKGVVFPSSPLTPTPWDAFFLSPQASSELESKMAIARTKDFTGEKCLIGRRVTT